MVAKTLKLLLLLGFIFLVGWIVYQSTTIILYILFSAVVALIGRPVFHLLERIEIKGKKMPDGVLAGLTILVIFGAVGTLFGTFLPMVFTEAQLLSEIDLDKVKASLAPAVESINELLIRFNLNKGQETDTEFISYLFNTIDMSLIPNIFNSLVGAFGNFLIALFSIAFISFFFLKDEHMLSRLIIRITPSKLEPSFVEILTNTRKTLSRYFLGLVIQIIAISTCIFIGLSILGVKNALLIAVFTGIVNLVPYLGPWIGFAFGLFILVANNIDASFAAVIQPKMLGMVAVFGITQLLDNYLFQPTIFSNSINAHPLEIFIVILIAGTIGGVGGMIAAIPVYAFLRIVFIELNNKFMILDRLKNRG